MSHKLEDLIRLKKNQVKHAALIFAKAFHNDPLAKWFFSEKEKRQKMLEHYFRFKIRYGLLFGEVYATSTNIEGLAVWLPSQYVKMTNWRTFQAGGLSLFPKLGIENIKKMLSAGNFINNIHHQYANFPHWYLSPIGVDPEYQGKGFASTLLRAMFNRSDKEKIPCLLETQSEINVDIYKHFGFEVVEKTVFPNTNLNHWIMLRKPEQGI